MVIIFLAHNLATFSVVMDLYVPHPWLSMAPCAALHSVQQSLPGMVNAFPSSPPQTQPKPATCPHGQ